MLAGAQELQKQMRRQLEPSVLDGTLSSADLQKLLPSAEAVWHEPKHLPPKSQPKVPVPAIVENGYSFRMRNVTVSWRSKDFAAQLPECSQEESCRVDMFLAECWRTLPGSQPPKPPPQCSVCRPDQSATLELPYLQTGEDAVLTLALPSLAVLKPQLSSDVFRAEVKLGKYAVSAVHSRTMQRLDATVATMKHLLDVQLVAVRIAVQRLFDRQRDDVLGQLTDAASQTADAIAELSAARSQREGHERLAVDAMAALAKRLEHSRAAASQELAEQHVWAQQRLLPSFCSSKDYLYRTC